MENKWCMYPRIYKRVAIIENYKKMSNRIKKNIHLLKVLHDSKNDTRKAILERANKDLIDTICECIHNILKGNLKVSPDVFRKLKRHQKDIREIYSKKAKLNRKKKLLIQHGGFLPALLAPILAIAGSLISGLVK